MPGQIQLPEMLRQHGALLGSLLLGFVFLIALLFIWLARKRLHGRETKTSGGEHEPFRADNEPLFVAASMKGVIEKLKEQEKELERLHRLEKQRAQQSERLSEAVTRNMPAGLLLVNSAGLINASNPAAETVLGARTLSFRRYVEVFGSDSPLSGLLTACLQEGRTFQREEVAHKTPSGEQRHLGVTVSPIFHPPGDPKGKITGAVCLLSDLTELTALQEQMRLKENLAALGEMSAGIAHEFKNSLATISGYAQMIRSEAGAGELGESAEKIFEQTQALTHVVTEFLKFARPLDVSAEEVNLKPVVDRVVAEIGEALPAVKLTCAGEFAEVSGDEGLLRQALLNLARNAAEAATVGGAGRVSVTGAVADNAGRPGQRISVTDNGPGIPPGDLSKIFLPFYTTKADGTGLGLALVQKIIVQHGGSVAARNRAGGGAEFIVWLPLRRERPQAVESAPGRI